MISIKEASVIYDNGTKGIANVSMDINPGEFVFIVGASGSGKSTLIRMLLRELSVSSGSVLVDDVDLASLKNRRLPYYRRRIGVVFQDFRLLPNKTVYENVAFTLRVTEAPQRDIKRNVPAVLTMVGLQKKSRSYPNELSGGELQRCALARAIVNKPPLLLCDEPTGNLDPDTAWDIMDLLMDINERGTTVIVATHAKEVVDAYRKRVVALKRGRVVRDSENSAYSETNPQLNRDLSWYEDDI